MQDTRQQVAADWRTTAEALRRHGAGALAAQVDRFVARMPEALTDDQRLAQRWREAQKSQMLERSEVKLPEPRAR
ncbi:hypothetical protein D9M72_563830 [compost metagenome]